jgi:hypothetical protein
LVVVRLGATTLADDRLAHACERTYERWGVWGFSVLEVSNGDDYGLLVRLRRYFHGPVKNPGWVR